MKINMVKNYNFIFFIRVIVTAYPTSDAGKLFGSVASVKLGLNNITHWCI